MAEGGLGTNVFFGGKGLIFSEICVCFFRFSRLRFFSKGLFISRFMKF